MARKSEITLLIARMVLWSHRTILPLRKRHVIRGVTSGKTILEGLGMRLAVRRAFFDWLMLALLAE